MRAAGRVTVGGCAVVLAVACLAGPASAKGGSVGGLGNQYFLNDGFTGTANTVFTYGDPGDDVYVGDWNGDHVDTLMIRRGNSFYVRNSNSTGAADTVFSYGNPGDTVLVGDWNGDGLDTLAVRRGNTFYVKNSITTGVADTVFSYGDPGDTVLVGDWDGNHTDTLAVRRSNQYFVKNSITTGVADTVFYYGNPGDSVLVGHWSAGQPGDSLGVRRGNTYYLRYSLTSGVADKVFAYGNPDDTALVGDWNGDGVDTLGVRRPPPDPNQDWLGEVNKYRVASGLAPVTDNPAWDTGIQHHNTYLANTPPSYMTGQYQSPHTENPASPYYTSDGALEAGRSNIMIGFIPSPVATIDGWLAAPFHAAGMLAPGLQRVAYASNGIAAGLDIYGGWTYQNPSAPILFPGPGMTTNLRSYSGGETPDPLQTCGWPAGSGAGLPLIAMLPTAPAAGATATVTGSDGSTASTSSGSLCLVDDPSEQAVFLIRQAVYAPGTYTATINQPGASPISWTFTIS